MEKLIKPKKLKTGDLVGIISPSAPLAGMLPQRVARGVKMLEFLGLKVKIGSSALKITGQTAGLAKERAKDINDFFADKKIKAIFTFIGGNHSKQTLPYLDFELIKNNPKIFIGYSDNTILEFSFYTQANLVSFYGPAILTQFAEHPQIYNYTKRYLKKALFEVCPIGKIFPSSEWTDQVLDWFKKSNSDKLRKMKKNEGWFWIKKGKAEGKILGGCISSMMSLKNTKFWPNFSDSFLFWEIPESELNFRKGESVENIKIYLNNLKTLGVFSQIKGMIVGRPFGYSRKDVMLLKRIIKDITKNYNFPVLFNVDIGHTDPMITVPQGIKIRIDSQRNLFEFIERGTK